MSDDKLFYKTLEEKYHEILKVAVKKKYIFLVPSFKYVTQNMLNKSFFENHTFYQCEYDSSLFISLQGKVLKFENNAFKTYLGHKKEMVFNVVEELYKEVNIQGLTINPTIKAMSIDNVIDESCYNTTNINVNNNFKKEAFVRFNTKEEYKNFYKNYFKSNPTEYKEIETALNELAEKLINNYILIKNYVPVYAMHFQQESNPFKKLLESKFEKFKSDQNFLLIINELAETLIFEKMFSYIYYNLKQFNKAEEDQLKLKIKNMEFNFTNYNLDKIYNECKFTQTIEEFRKISNYQTIFEKLKVICNVLNLIQKEAKECFEKNSSQNKKVIFTPEGDNLLAIGIYLIINADIKNIITEINILQNFRIKESFLEGEAEYALTTFILSLMNLTEGDKKVSYTTQYINPSSNSNNLNNTTNMDFSFSKTNTTFTPKLIDDDDNRSRQNTIAVNKNKSEVKDLKNMFSK